MQELLAYGIVFLATSIVMVVTYCIIYFVYSAKDRENGMEDVRLPEEKKACFRKQVLYWGVFILIEAIALAVFQMKSGWAWGAILCVITHKVKISSINAAYERIAKEGEHDKMYQEN